MRGEEREKDACSKQIHPCIGCKSRGGKNEEGVVARLSGGCGRSENDQRAFSSSFNSVVILKVYSEVINCLKAVVSKEYLNILLGRQYCLFNDYM